MRTRTFFVVALVAALLVAGGVSYFASSNPDGLEYVAEKVGFADAAEDHAAADSPLSDYQVKGVENDALSGGLAGVLGALVVLVLAGGLAWLVRRRGDAPDEPNHGNPRDAHENPVLLDRREGQD
ncbi:PDGLE domain-containing protein [Nocardioides pakistanensis]